MTVLALVAVNLYALYTHHKEAREWAKERKDLYDRIMSKDLREYKQETAEVKTYEPLDNSEEAEYYREQEAMRRM